MRLFPILVTSVAFAACGKANPKPKTAANQTQADGSQANVASADADLSRQAIILGWFCPEAAAGRPGIRPLLFKDSVWSSDKAALTLAVASRRVKRFSVLAWKGHLAGSMSVVAAARDATGTMATGAYLGTSACQNKQGGATNSLQEDPTCVALTKGCTLAVGGMEAAGGFHSRPYEEDPERLSLFQAAACEANDVLGVDVDGDGIVEYFSLSDLVTEVEAPVELPLLPGQEPCTPSMSPAVGRAEAQRIAVLDLDGDGRPEIVYRRGGEFLVYGAPTSPARLELLGRQTLTF